MEKSQLFYKIICHKVEHNPIPFMHDTAKHVALGTLLNGVKGGMGISFQLGFI